MPTFDFSKTFTQSRREEFARILLDLQHKIGFKISSRGWCYIMENARYINKNQFNKVEAAINNCRRDGYLPVDFVAEEDARAFSGVESKSKGTVKDTLKWMLSDVLNGSHYYTPDWWEGEEVYIQMVVEKIDLKTLFQPVCEEYHIAIANSKGWSSILQRAEYAKRFKDAENKGLECVLLYCGDHDPDGLRISDTLRANLDQLRYVRWSNGESGYNPRDLRIERFGLNYDFIEDNGYTWIDNLITGSGKDLADPNHKNHGLGYVQEYLSEIGERKCEANAVVTTPDEAQQMCRDAIESFVGSDALDRFADKRAQVDQDYDDLLERLDLKERITKIIEENDEE
jgi:hypothetical protein